MQLEQRCEELDILSDASFISSEGLPNIAQDEIQTQVVSKIVENNVDNIDGLLAKPSCFQFPHQPNTYLISSTNAPPRIRIKRRSSNIELSVPDNLPRNSLSVCEKQPNVNIGDKTDGEPLIFPSKHKNKNMLHTPSSSLDLSAIDDPEISHQFNSLSLSQPKVNSVRALQEDVVRLSQFVSNASNTTPCPEAQKEALCRLVDQYSLNDRPRSPRISNIPVSVNFPPKDSIYVNLLELSVTESEIVREEKAKFARRRRHLLSAFSKITEDVIPEPCTMTWFDPRKHVFQSARLQIMGMPQLLPGLKPISGDLLNEIHNDYRRSLFTHSF